MDYYGNGVTSNVFSGTRNALDVETIISGTVVDPRARIWTLLNSTDSVNAVQSGTWTVQQGSPPWSVSQSGTWTTGRTWTLGSGTDSVTSFQGTSPWVTNITQFGGSNLSTGTGASGAGIPRVTVSNDSNLLASQSGTWTVQQGAIPTTAANGWPVKPTDGTNTITVKAASTAAVATDTAQVVAISPNNTVGVTQSTAAAASGAWPVKVTDGTNVAAVKAASTAPIATDPAQVVALSPNGAQATAALQTTGNTSLSAINTAQSSGAQKSQIVDGSGNVIGPTMTFSGVNYLPVSNPVDVASSIVNVTTQDLASTTAVGFANQSLISGTPTAGSAASFSVSSIQTVMILVSGTWTGTLSMEVSENGGTTWEPRSIHVIGTNTFSSSITANVAGSMNAAGKSNVRARGITAMTGTASVQMILSDNASNMYIANALRLVDGSATPNVNTLVIKTGSVSPLFTDTAAVFTQRPDNVGTPTQTSVSCASTSTTLLAANTATLFLSVRNPTTATQTIWINVVGSAAVAAAPSVDLPPGAEADYFAQGASFLPTAQINCISGGTASTVTLVYK